MIKINTELTEEEAITLVDTVRDHLIDKNYEANTWFLTNQITEEQLDWIEKHHQYLTGIMDKLFPGFKK